MESEPASRATVVELEGKLEGRRLASARKAVEAHLAAGRVRLVIDLHGITFIGSQGISLLLGTSKRARSAGGDLVLARASSFLRGVLKTLGIDGQLLAFDSVPEAVRSLRADGPPERG